MRLLNILIKRATGKFFCSKQACLFKKPSGVPIFISEALYIGNIDIIIYIASHKKELKTTVYLLFIPHNR